MNLHNSHNSHNIDPRIKDLSYSSRLTLHACPKKFQLYRLNSKQEEPEAEVGLHQSVTFAFGHAVGLGIQLSFLDKTEDEILWEMFLNWEPDLEARDERRKKSFYLAVSAVQTFLSLKTSGLFENYELVFYSGKPAIELSFRITFPGDFYLRGFVDVVLRHKETGEVIVVELKTTSATNINSAQYKNSAQAIGYSVVLDVIFPELSSYKVIYLVYLTKSFRYEIFEFNKSYLQRALWINEILLDIDMILLYEKSGVYPMHGENCLQFYRECEYLNLCTLSISRLTSPFNPEEYNKKQQEYLINLTLEDLINSQLSKEEIEEIAEEVSFEKQLGDTLL